MRRLVATAALALFAVIAAPVPADAYFWKWIDDLSGPQFAGVLGELELVCPGKTDLAQSPEALESIKNQLIAEKKLYEAGKSSFGPAAQKFVGNAIRYRAESEDVLEEAVAMRAKGPLPTDKAGQYERRVTATVIAALAWQERAAAHFAWAKRLHKDDDLDPRKEPGTFDVIRVARDDDAVVMTMVPAGGIKWSLCKYRPLQRNRFSFSANVGLAPDTKNDDEGTGGRHWMLTFGGSANFAFTPWLTGAIGGGRAIFLPSGAGSRNFGKWYFQPFVDIKPGAMVPRANLRSPWRHFVFVRYGVITFPQGFEAGDFTPNSPAYDQEWIQTVGVHFDLTPVLRGRKGNW